jgi:Intron-binding protein aquarius N-terminus
LQVLRKERTFLRNLIDRFFVVLDNAGSEESISYCENFLMLMIDLEALLPTRRFFNTVLDDR